MANYQFGITEKCPFFGRAVLFSFESFESNPKAIREGSVKDRETLTKLFQDLGLLVTVELNRTADQVQSAVQRICAEDHLDLFICIFLSHGHSNKYFFTYNNQSIDMDSILVQFERSNKLKSSVKIYLANFCREGEAEINSRNLTTETGSHSIFPLTNTLKVFSTLPGNVSWRNKISGSYFISQFVKAVRSCAPYFEVAEILIQANVLIKNKLEDKMKSQHAQENSTILFMEQALHVEMCHFDSRCYLMPQVRWSYIAFACSEYCFHCIAL